MRIIDFENYEHLSEFLYKIAGNNRVACVVLSYDITCELLRELLLLDGVEVGSICLESEDYSGYNREYYVSLDTDLIIDVSPAWFRCENKPSYYLYHDADFYLFDGDAHSSILNTYSDSLCYEIRIKEKCNNTVINADRDLTDFISQISGLLGLLF